MPKVVSRKVCLRMISTLHASYDITNSRRCENTLFSWFLKLLKTWNFKKVITSLNKLCAALNTFFLFILFKDWVFETQLRIAFLTPNTGVWNQLHKTLTQHHQIWIWANLVMVLFVPTQLTFPCSKSTIETLEIGKKYVQS